ncbi:hypothetical protein AVEN_139513-1, partial [Araneus ventricosus]
MEFVNNCVKMIFQLKPQLILSGKFRVSQQSTSETGRRFDKKNAGNAGDWHVLRLLAW